MNVFVCGDFHANWGYVNDFLNKHRNIDILLQCGDFGYWPEHYPVRLTNKDTKIYFCKGNHEDHFALKTLTTDEIAPNVFFQENHTVLTLPDGRNVLFLGGAESVDRYFRTAGLDWFPEDERLTQKDIDVLPDIRVDIMITHTCPNEFVMPRNDEFLRRMRVPEGWHDMTQDVLTVALEKYHPELWYFGHWHNFKQGTYKNTKWTALNCVGNRTRWFIKLEEGKTLLDK